MALTRDQQEMLEFERRWPKHNNDKINAVREYWQLTISEYEKLLEELVELPSAAEYDADLVKAVKRLRRGERWYATRQQGEWA